MKKVFVCAVLFSGLAAQANAMEEAPAISFTDLDINNNGALSVAEAYLDQNPDQWQEILAENRIQLDLAEFNRMMSEQQERARRHHALAAPEHANHGDRKSPQRQRPGDSEAG